MKVKRMVKRLFAVGTGVVMLGATAMGALGAADLKDYPSMFVKDGVFDGVMVIGKNSNPIDNIAMTDIVAGMKYNKLTESSTVTVSGDAWMVGTSAKKLEMTDNGATASVEQVLNITSYIGKDELAALGKGTYSNSNKEYDYNQYIYFDAVNGLQNGVVKFVESDNPATNEVTADYFYYASGAQIGRYKLEFTSPAESDVASDLAGTAATNGQYLSDFDNTKINMLGQEYTIVLATRPTSAREDSVKLTLMSGAASDSLLEGEEKTYTLDGKEYKIKLTYVDDDEAKFTINGETVDKMQVGQTKKLSDGKEVGVSEILYQSYAGGVHSAVFFLGAQKLVLQDDTITDSNTGYEAVGGSETIDGAHVIITGTDDNTTFKLNTIEINMSTEDEYYVAAGSKLSEVIADVGDEKEVLFTNNWDIEYKGLTTEATHDIKLSSNSDRKYTLSWYDGDGNKVDMPLAYANTSAVLIRGDDSSEKFLWIDEVAAANISKNDYFVVTGGSVDGVKGQAKSYLLQYKGADDSAATSPKIQFKNLGSGETVEYSVATSGSPVATLKLGGYSCRVYNTSALSVDDFRIAVDANCGDSAVANAGIQIKDYYGAKINITTANLTNGAATPLPHDTQGISNITVRITTPSADDYDNIAPLAVVATISATSTNEVRASMDSTYSLLTPEGMSDVTYGYTTMGGKLTFASPSGAPNELTYEYPEAQRLPQVYFTSGAVTSSSSEGTWTAVEVVDATKFDDEVDSVSAQNMIVVGGPCVNSVAAELLGNPAACADGFTPGKARVKLFENSGKVAMLVAGYSGEDTRLAGRVIAHRWKELTGTEAEISGTTYSDATIGAPTVVETPVVEEVPAETITE